MSRRAGAPAERLLAFALLMGTTLSVGCGVGGVPIATAQPPARATAPATIQPTPAPSASPSDPAPTGDALQGPPTVVAVQDGIRLELWLPDDRVVIGERTFARVRVTNDKDRAVDYDASCGVGRITLDYGGLLPAGRDWPGLAGLFKARVLRENEYGLRRFDGGQRGCGVTVAGGRVEPGQTVETVRALDPSGRRMAPIVPGAAAIFATFSYGFEPSADPQPPGTVATIPVDVTIIGQATSETPLATYLDKMLAEPRFTDWLQLRDEETWNITQILIWTRDEGPFPDSPCLADAREGAIEIGLFRMGEPDDFDEEYGAVVLDLTSGEVLGSRLGFAYDAALECR